MVRIVGRVKMFTVECYSYTESRSVKRQIKEVQQGRIVKRKETGSAEGFKKGRVKSTVKSLEYKLNEC